VALDKVMYRCRVGNKGWVRISPIGGEGQDAAATLNPLKGASLTVGLYKWNAVHP
jgi:hypothetical protein